MGMMADWRFMQRQWLFGVALAASGCGRSARPVEFQGHPAEPVVAPEAVLEASALPRGAERLGRLFVRCHPVDGAESFSERTLLDVDCSEVRLRRLLREAASEHGGDVLAELSCQQGSTLTCRATLARSGSHAAAAPPSAGASGADVHGELAARVLVSYELRSAERPRSALAEDNVRELSNLSPAQISVGNLEIRCEACSELSARDALRIAAGRLGASDVVGVRCVSEGEGQRCLGEAAVWERREP
jgi:hypothetical protein